MSRPRVAVWGAFDVSSYGDLLVPRVVEMELLRRLPRAEVCAFAPLGWLHPVPQDGGFVAEPLGERTPERVRELAARFDLVLLAAGAELTEEFLADCYGEQAAEAGKSAPDDWFRAGLAGGQEGSPAVVVEDIGSLAARCGAAAARFFDAALIERRLRFLRAAGLYPEAGRPLGVQGDRASLAEVEAIAGMLEAIARDRPGLPLVILELASCLGDGEFAAALSSRLPAAYRMDGVLGIEDAAAALSGGAVFLGTSGAGALTSAAFGVPAVRLDLANTSLAEDLTRALSAVSAGAGAAVTAERHVLLAEIDREFDRLAGIAQSAWRERAGNPAAPDASAWARALEEAETRYGLLKRAHAARGRQLVDQRLRFAELADVLGGNRDAPRLAEELAALRRSELMTRATLHEKLTELEVLRLELQALREEAERARAEATTLRGRLAELKS